MTPRLILAVLLCAAPLSLFAEDPSHGKLPDGRAFRVDSEGNEIVDYIAELETTNDSLNRRIHGLESEVEEKQKQLERLQQGGGRDLVEHDIGAGGTSASKVAPVPQAQTVTQIVTKEVADPRVLAELTQTQNELAAEREARTQERARLENQLRDLQSNLQRKTTELSQANSEQIRRSNDTSSREITTLRAKISSLEDALSKKNTEIDTIYSQMMETSAQIDSKKTENDRLKAQNVELYAKIETQSGALDRVRSESSDLKAESARLKAAQAEATKTCAAQAEASKASAEQLVALQAKFDSVQGVLGSRETEIERLKDQVARRAAQPIKVAAVSAVESKAQSAAQTTDSSTPLLSESVSPARIRAIAVLKGRLGSELTSIKQLIAERDSLYHEYSRAGHGQVTFKAAAPVSARGIGVREIEGRLKAITSVLELSALNRDISEIETKVRDDIQLIERMKRMRGGAQKP